MMVADKRFDWNVQANARPNLVDILEGAGIAEAARDLPPAPVTSPCAPTAAGDIPGVLPDSGGLAPWWVPPAQLVPASEESFGFDYRVIGHDPDGQPVIAATVSAAFQFPATSPLFPTARPVTWTALSAVLTIPVNDVVTGRASTVELPITTVAVGDVVKCSVEITGSLARATYGVLSTPGFQGTARAVLTVTTTFDALQTVSYEEKTVRVWVKDPPREFDEPPAVRHLPPGGHYEWKHIPAHTETFLQSFNLKHQLPLFVPCTDHPDLYREVHADGTTSPIGCREALSLGSIPNRRFVEAHQYDRQGRYTVWEATQQRATFLVVPMHYRISRGPGGTPQIEWLQVFDSADDIALPCLLQAQCVPDLTPVELAVLSAEIAKVSGLQPKLLLPTSPAVGSTGVDLKATTLGQELAAVMDNDVVHLAVRVSYVDAAVMSNVIKEGEAIAQMAFETGDPMLTLTTTVHLAIDELAGPYPLGPIQVSDGKILNVADTKARVTTLWSLTDGNWTATTIGVPLTVPPGEAVDLPAGSKTATLAQAELEPPNGSVIAMRSLFVDDLHTTVQVRNDVNYAALHMESVNLTFTSGTHQIGEGDLTSAVFIREIPLVQPLGPEPAGPAREVTVTPLVTEIGGHAQSVPATKIDLSKGIILRLSELLSAPG